MGCPQSGVPDPQVRASVSLWWRRRVRTLLAQQRPHDARSLYLEFADDRHQRLCRGDDPDGE